MADYYDEKTVKALVVEYLSYDPKERKIDKTALKIRETILIEVGKIVNGIIFKHSFTVWENFNDLYQEAMEACTKALEKFDPFYITSKGTYASTFNYFSLTAKHCLKYYTMRNQKNRNNYAIDDYANTLQYEDISSENSHQMVSKEFINQLKDVFQKTGNSKFMPLIDILEDYLNKIGSFNKRDYFRFSRSLGWSPNLIRKFLKIIKDNRDEFYNF